MTDPTTPAHTPAVLPEPGRSNHLHVMGAAAPLGHYILYEDHTTQLQAALDRAERAEKERNRQYDENVNRIVKESAAEAALDEARKVIKQAREKLAVYSDPTGYTDSNGEQLSADEELHPGLAAMDGVNLCTQWLAANQAKETT